jgi:hypothetical protein
MYVRTKKIALDGAEFLVASLSVEQVETIVIAPLSEAESAAGNPYETRVYDVICASLNRAILSNGVTASVEDQWDTKRLKSVLDSLTIHWLYDEIIAFTGLRKRTAEDAPGESVAAAPATA